MAGAADHLPDDMAALKAALIETRAKLVGAETMIEHLHGDRQDEAGDVRSALRAQPAAHRSTGIATGGAGRSCGRGCDEGGDGARPGARLHAAPSYAAQLSRRSTAPADCPPDRLHEEISADYTDMIYGATREEIEARRKA